MNGNIQAVCVSSMHTVRLRGPSSSIKLISPYIQTNCYCNSSLCESAQLRKGCQALYLSRPISHAVMASESMYSIGYDGYGYWVRSECLLPVISGYKLATRHIASDVEFAIIIIIISA